MGVPNRTRPLAACSKLLSPAGPETHSIRQGMRLGVSTSERSLFRERRAAKNQSLFREVNERIEPLNQSFSPSNRLNEFLCECANETCSEHVSMTVEEYEAVRASSEQFAVMPDDAHVWPDVERVVDRHDRYWVVEKLDYAGGMAAKLDPRSRSRLDESPL